jgi:hypothetical protein
VSGYVRGLQRFRYPILAVMVGLLAASAFLAPKLLGETTNSYNPPDNTEAAKANARLGVLFPQFAHTTSLGVLIQLTNKSMVRALCLGTQPMQLLARHACGGGGGCCACFLKVQL